MAIPRKTAAITAMMVGLGSIGQRHVRNLRMLVGEDLDLITARTRGLNNMISETMDSKQCDDLAQEYGIRTFDSINEALGERPNMVFVTNPTSLHVKTAMTAVLSGCSVFVEKPLSHNMAMIGDLIDRTEASGITTMVGYQMRFHPCLIRLREAISQRELGNIYAVRAEVGEYLPNWHPYENYRDTYASKRNLGGGVILTQIHEFDYLYWLFGLPRRVFALGGTLSALDIDVEDVSSVLLDCEVNGARIPIHVHQDYLQNPPARTCHIIGENGKIFVDLLANTFSLFDRIGHRKEHLSFPQINRNELFIAELAHFVESVEANIPSALPFREGAQSLRVALAVKQSLKSRQVVELDAIRI